MKNIPLTKIGFFNPGRLTDEEVEQMFIARNSLFQHIFNRIIAEHKGSIPQHYLLIGQRGMGKTSMLLRVAAELRKNPYKESLIALTFPEEQYNVDRLSKFWLNCMDALADALDKEGQSEDLKKLDKEIEFLAKNKHAETATIYDSFIKWTDKIKRRPVLLVDNLNLIFEKISKDEQHQLRAILMKPSSPILVGASAITIEDTVDYSRPFYDAFQTLYLKKLTFEESLDVLRNLAKITGNEVFENEIYQHKGRLQALYQLTGGTPRTLSILFPLIQAGFSERIQTDLDSILDAITPLYKARFEELAPQLQVVLDSVALNWDPTTIDKLRNLTQLNNQQLAPQLKRLVDIGWLQKLSGYKSKGNAYELSERFFNIWYIMRRSSRRQKRELYCLTKFLESYYGKELVSIAKKRIDNGCVDEDQAVFDLALADAVGDSDVSAILKKNSYNFLVDLSFINSGIQDRYDLPTNIVSNRIKILWEDAIKLYNEKKYEETKLLIEKILVKAANSKDAFIFLGLLNTYYLEKPLDGEDAFRKANNGECPKKVEYYYLGKFYFSILHDYDKSESFYKKAIDMDSNFGQPWCGLGDLYYYGVAKYKDAESAYKEAIKLNSGLAEAWYGLGALYHDKLERYKEAEEAYTKAISINARITAPWIGLGNLYQSVFKKYSDSEEAYLKAIDIDENNSIAWNNLGNLYQDNLSRFDEAEKAYYKAIALNDKYAVPWNGLGNLYASKKKFVEAEAAFKMAISLDGNFALPWHGLGNIYSYNLERYSEAEEAYKKAISIDNNYATPWYGLGVLYQFDKKIFGDSESAYKEAILRDKNNPDYWFYLGVLYENDLQLYSKAEEAYKKAISLTEDSARIWIYLGNLYQFSLKMYTEAEYAYRMAITKESWNADSWNFLGLLYQNDPSKYSDSEAAFLKAIELNKLYVAPWVGLGNLYANKLKRFKQAEEAYKHAISIDDKNAASWNFLGTLYQSEMNRHEESEIAFKKAIELDKDFASPWVGLGNLYALKYTRFTEAEKAYKEAISIDGKNAFAWYFLGNLYHNELGKYVEAEKAYTKATEFGEYYSYGWFGLGNLYREIFEKYTEAEKAYKKALSIDELNTHIWNVMGCLYQDNLKQYKEAEFAYRKSIELDSNNPYPKYNLVFLLRDNLGRIDEAMSIFMSISNNEALVDSHDLNKALFELYKGNIGNAEEKLQAAISFAKEGIPKATTDDWYRTVSVMIKMGFGNFVLKLLERNEWNILMRPFYVAIEALEKADGKLYLNSFSVEVREPALKIMNTLSNYNK